MQCLESMFTPFPKLSQTLYLSTGSFPEWLGNLRSQLLSGDGDAHAVQKGCKG